MRKAHSNSATSIADTTPHVRAAARNAPWAAAMQMHMGRSRRGCVLRWCVCQGRGQLQGARAGKCGPMRREEADAPRNAVGSWTLRRHLSSSEPKPRKPKRGTPGAPAPAPCPMPLHMHAPPRHTRQRNQHNQRNQRNQSNHHPVLPARSRRTSLPLRLPSPPSHLPTIPTPPTHPPPTRLPPASHPPRTTDTKTWRRTRQ
jgi:hypothetical protein